MLQVKEIILEAVKELSYLPSIEVSDVAALLKRSGKEVDRLKIYPALRTLALEGKITKVGRGSYIAIKQPSTPPPLPTRRMARGTTPTPVVGDDNTDRSYHAAYVELYAVRRILTGTIKSINKTDAEGEIAERAHALLKNLDMLITTVRKHTLAKIEMDTAMEKAVIAERSKHADQ